MKCLRAMLLQDPIELKPNKNLLSLPSHPRELHPLHEKLSLIICFLSQKLENTELSSRTQDIIMASWRSGTAKQYRTFTCQAGNRFAVRRTLIKISASY